jgi:hypothetical protein
MASSTPAHIRLARHYTPDPATGCWNWTGSLSTRYLYPTFTDADGNIVYAYRWMYEQAFGPIPADHHVHHTCHNNRCINPSHLKALTPEEHRAAHKAERAAKIVELTPLCISLLKSGRTISEIKKASGVPKYALKKMQRELVTPVVELPAAA